MRTKVFIYISVIIPFRPTTPWYSYPPPCYAPAVWSLKFERYRARPWMILLIPGWLCARRSRALFYLHRSSQGNDCVATSVHLHVGGSPVSRPSTRSPQRPGTRGFQAGSLGRRGAHFPVHSPGVLPLPNTQWVGDEGRLSLKEEGINPQSRPSPRPAGNPCY